jgi:hypothetical protein
MPGRIDLDLYNVLLGFGWARGRGAARKPKSAAADRPAAAA